MLQNFDLNQHFEKRKFALVNDGDFPALDFTFRLTGFNNDLETYLFEGNYWAIKSNGDTIIPFDTQNRHDNGGDCMASMANNSLQPLLYIDFNVPELGVMDTIFVEYYLFNCCPENNDDYFDKDIYYNTWSFNGSFPTRYFNECGQAYQMVIGNVVPPQSTIFSGGLLAPIRLGLEQTLNFSAISHLNGAANCSGDITTVGVVNSNFNGSGSLSDQSDDFFFDNQGNSLNGQFRLDISTEFGLNIHNNLFPYITLSDGVTSLIPDSIVRIQPYNSASEQGTIIYAYFPANAFSDYATMDNFLSNSVFNFQVQACCPGLPQPAIKADLRVNLNPDNCQDCWIPLSSQTDTIAVLCPGCITPGLVVEESVTKRRNYGFVDSNNNGLADIPLTPLDPNGPFENPFTPYYGMFGDTFDIHANAICYAGTDNNTDGGVSFSSWTNYWGPMESLYVDVQSPNCGESNNFNFNAVEATLKVKLNGSSAWSPPINILPLLQTASYPLFFEIDYNFLRNADSYFPSNFNFDPSNEYEVDIAFTICGNDVNLPDFKDCPVNTLMWWGNSNRNENAALQIEQAGDRNEAFAGTNNSNLTTLLERIENLHPDSALFYCESNGSTIRLFRYTETVVNNWVNSTSYSGNTCTKRLESQIQIQLGNLFNNNMFPNEFRPMNFAFNGLEFTSPLDYSLLNQTVSSRFSIDGQTHLATDTNLLFNYTNNSLFEINNSEYQYATEDMFFSSTTSSDQTFFPLGDGVFFQTINLFFSPDSTCSSDTLIMSDNEPSTYLSTPGCASAGLDTFQSNIANPITKLFLPFPPMEYSNGANNLYAIGQDTFCDIEFNIINPSHWPDNSVNVLNAYHPFIYAEHPDLTILSLDRWVNNSWQSVPQNLGGVFELPTLIRNSSFELRMCLAYKTCEGDSLIDLPIRYGYQCGGHLQSPLDMACFDSTAYVSLTRVAASLNQGPFEQDTTFNLCDTIAMSACTFATSPGEINHLYTILTLPIGASITDIVVSFPGTNNPSVALSPSSGQLIPPNSWQFNVPNSNWALTTETADTLCYSFAFEYTPSCQIIQSGPPTVLIGGVAYCGDTITPQILNFDTVELVGNNCTPLVIDSTSTIDAVCGTNGEIHIGVSGQAPFTFDWQPNNQQTTVPNIVGLGPGFYNVTVTDGNGCDTLVQGIEVGDSLVLLDPISLSYDTCLSSVTLTAPSGSSFSWNTNDTTQSIIVTQTGFYKVQVNQNGCLGTVSTTINSLPTPANLNINIVIGTNQNSQTLLSDVFTQYPQLTGGIVGENILINGELLVNIISYDIKNSNLYFSPGSGITFDDALYNSPGIGNYSIKNSNLNALSNCSTMWRGIIIGHKVVVAIDQSDISNAMYGIQTLNKSYLKATNTVFSNNFIGIFLPPHQYNMNYNSGLMGFYVDNCSFEGVNSGLLNTYPGQTSYLTNLLQIPALPAQGKKPLAGVYGVNVYGYSINNSNFEYLALGIKNVHTSYSFYKVNVNNCQFDDITNTAINGMNHYGLTILSSKDRLGIAIDVRSLVPQNSGYLNSNYNLINDGSIGLYVSRTNFSAKGNILNNLKTGIFQTESSNSDSYLLNNEVNNCRNAISLSNNKPFKNLSIEGNVINLSNSAINLAMGISIAESNPSYSPPQDYGMIKENTITMIKGQTGMYFSSTDSLIIDDNVISMGNGSISTLNYGIKIDGGQEMVFADNKVNNNGAVNYSNSGSTPKSFDLNDCIDCLLECNSTNKTQIGVHVKNNLSGFEIKGHVFGSHGTGLKYSNGINIGLQNFNGNQWLGTYSIIQPGIGGGAAYNGNYNGGSTFGQEFEIANPVGSSFFPINTYPKQPLQSETWFNSGNTQIDFDCALDAQYKSGTPSSIITDELVAKGKYPLPNYEEPLNLNGQRSLYEKIEKGKIDIGESLPIDSFYFANQSTAVKTLYDAKLLEESKALSKTNEKEELSLNKNQILILERNMLALDSTHQEDTTINLLYLQQKESLLQQMNNLSSSGVNVNIQIKTADDLITSASKQKYDEANPIYTLDYNTKYTAKVYLESSAINLPIPNLYLNELQNIAEQCPSAGGKGVYIARNLLQTYYEDTTLIWEDDYRCLVAGYNLYKQPDEEMEEEENLLIPKISIYPNPNDGSFLIQLANTDKVEIQILDLLGKSIFTKEYIDNISIPLQLKMSKGVYILNIKQNKQIIHQEKIIIQ